MDISRTEDVALFWRVPAGARGAVDGVLRLNELMLANEDG